MPRKTLVPKAVSSANEPPEKGSSPITNKKISKLKSPSKSVSRKPKGISGTKGENHIIIEQNESIPMEVHHHPQLEHKPKPWKEYLLEGLMIFLAVFMGFIAENIRESYTEHKKAQAYATTMATDLAVDTTQLKNYLAYYSFAKMNIDTLMKLLANDDLKSMPTGKLYLYGLWGGSLRFFTPDDAAFQQMKSTGALQFFEKNVEREAGEYDRWCRNMQLRDESDGPVYTEVRKLRSQIFEFQYNMKANELWQQTSPNNTYSTKTIDKAKIDSFIKSNPPLLTYDKVIFNQYVELIRSRYIDRKITIADSVLVHATKLLGDIKKEYHIE